MQCSQCSAWREGAGLQLLEVIQKRWSAVSWWVKQASLFNLMKLRKAMKGKGFSTLYEKACVEFPECSGVPLNDLLSRMILLRVTIKIRFWCRCEGLDHDGQTWLFMWTTCEAFTVCPWLEFNPDQLSYNWDRDRDLGLFLKKKKKNQKQDPS